MRDAMDRMQKGLNGSVGGGLNKMTSADSMAALIRDQQYDSAPNLAGR